MQDLAVIDQPAMAQSLLDPYRSEILQALNEPGSASSVAAAIGEPRQKVNYHLRELEHLGLVTLVEERPKRGFVERVVQASARSYVVSPSALGPHAPSPERTDRLSARYLVALAARMVREIGELGRRADDAGKTLPTLAIDTDLRFATAGDRKAFTEELTAAVHDLAARYHAENAPRGRWHRLVIGAYPRPAETGDQP